MIASDTSEPAESRRTRVSGRRTWPQRLLLLAGLVTSVGLFLTAQFFWEARAVLADLPRIAVGPDILAQPGEPGDPVNLLLVGVDSSEGLDEDDPVRQGRDLEDEARGIVRPDTILIARLDPATGSASVLSLPRDLLVEAPGGAETRINATQTVGGVGSLIETIDSNFAIPINHFVVADFAGFAEVVDIVGGVPVYFPYPTRDLGSGLSIAAQGCWSLTGGESLGYVRARKLEELIDDEWTPLAATSPDLARIERQQEFMVLALEQILSVGRSDISRINDFIDAGTQAVQLDEQLTPGDMLDLAAAFADFDTTELEISTVPVRPTFSDDGRYLGEGLVEAESRPLLARFQGQADGIRPSQIAVGVQSSNDRQTEQLIERGFAAQRIESSEQNPRTRVVFDPDDRDATLLLTRYLEGVPPQLMVEPGADLRLDIGNDFAGVRLFPRPVADIAPGLDLLIRQAGVAVEPANSTTSSTETPQTSAAEPSSEASETTSAPSETSDTSFAPSTTRDLPSTLAPENTDVPKDPATADGPTPTIVLRGRPPAGAPCGPTGG